MTARAGAVASLVTAARFLTVVPLPGSPDLADAQALGRAAWWFPAVGLVLGCVLALVDRLLAAFVPPLLAAALVLLLWKGTTGGLHLDGLADSLDGLAAGDSTRRLAAMRDSRIGTFGACGLIASAMVAFAALAGLPVQARGPVLLLAPAVGRATPALAALCFGPATAGHGLGAAFLGAVPRGAGPTTLALLLALSFVLMGGAGVAVTAAAAGGSLAACGWLARRLSGATGDTLGAGVELSEVLFLVTGAACAHRGLI